MKEQNQKPEEEWTFAGQLEEAASTCLAHLEAFVRGKNPLTEDQQKSARFILELHAVHHKGTAEITVHGGE